ncbi:GFA family protein [Mangrovimicrobium sediminis]|uniref:GFA family protein n=1 Tax=Mangrovimicrobium sediminis TaxID=2562682 RepID=A0A4Z0LX24_9GAMM|nr:GFA family protein [Haliea sp. SAOS-164]TGD71774.1 GFA family protein [Haliea sp. SAOS-164]
MTYPMRGACQCGGVTYQLLKPPMKVIACHCRECQKLSTSAFSITALVETDAIEFQGELAHWERSSDSGNINAAKFCPTCGNRIYHFNPADPGRIKLKPATLDDTSIIEPTAHIWVSQKQAWFQIPEGVEVFQEQS